MRRHRVHEDELPSVKAGLYSYLSQQCRDPADDEANIASGFRLFYRVLSHRIGQPDYPSIHDENGSLDYEAIKAVLSFARETDEYLSLMVPLNAENVIPLEDIDQVPVWPRAGLGTSSFIGAKFLER